MPNLRQPADIGRKQTIHHQSAFSRHGVRQHFAGSEPPSGEAKLPHLCSLARLPCGNPAGSFNAGKGLQRFPACFHNITDCEELGGPKMTKDDQSSSQGPIQSSTLGSVFLMLRSWPLGRPGAATAVVPGVPGPLQQPDPRESKHELKSGKLRLEDV